VTLYRLAQECAFADFHDHALALAGRLASFDSGRWGSNVITPGGLALHHAHLVNEPPETLAAYEEVKSQDHLVIAHRGRCGYMMIRSHPRTHYGAAEYLGMREYQRRFGHENALVLFHTRPGDLYTNYISLYRADERAQFGLNEAHVMEQAYPHLLEALRINCALNARDLVPGPCSGSHVGVADLLGRILFAEPRVGDLLAEEWHEPRNGRLPPVLFDALASVGTYRGSRVRAAASPIQNLLFFRLRERHRADSLSPRELEIARATARGASYKEAARELGLSPETVRSYLKGIHAKLGVRNRAELLAELAHIEAA